jgi:predicted AlkP superfamily pyrophosphatase or phosphodiesterase
VDAVDKIMHGMTLGTAGMHNQVRQWTAEGFLAQLLDLLLNHGYTVFLTSDHGNIEAVGCGSPAEGAVADMRGERVRVYPDPALRTQVARTFS